MGDSTREFVSQKLLEYVQRELLDEDSVADLSITTPLLEWGLLNSIETARLVAFIREELGVRVPPAELVSRNFKDINSITNLVAPLRPATA
jgi:acyl carrier protein